MRMRKTERRVYESANRGNEITLSSGMVRFVRENPFSTFESFKKEFPDATRQQFSKACDMA